MLILSRANCLSKVVSCKRVNPNIFHLETCFRDRKFIALQFSVVDHCKSKAMQALLFGSWSNANGCNLLASCNETRRAQSALRCEQQMFSSRVAKLTKLAIISGCFWEKRALLASLFRFQSRGSDLCGFCLRAAREFAEQSANVSGF